MLLVLIISVCSSLCLLVTTIYWKNKYSAFKIEHETCAKFWKQSMLEVASAHMSSYLESKKISNHTISTLKSGHLDVKIGDDNRMVSVDTELLKYDSVAALNDAHQRFMNG